MGVSLAVTPPTQRVVVRVPGVESRVTSLGAARFPALGELIADS